MDVLQKLGSYISTTKQDVKLLLNEQFDYIPTKTLSNLWGILSKRLGVLGRKGCTNQYFKTKQKTSILIALALLLI